MRKLLTSFCLLTLVLVCIFVMPANAEAASVADLTFELNSDGNSYSVTGCKSSASGAMEIPATYKGKPVTEIGYEAFYDCDSLTSVTVPDSVTTIGGQAFWHCSNLKTITISASVTSIGLNVFRMCTALTDVFVDANNPAYCSDQHSVLFNKDKTHLVQAPCSISGVYAIPNSVTEVCDLAFANCKYLTAVTMPDGITTVGNQAFRSCSGLTSVVLPASVTNIGEDAFAECYDLTEFKVDNNNLIYSTDDKGVLFNKDKTALIDAVLNLSGAYTVPASVTSIKDCAFQGQECLTSITIPDSVIAIGYDAFAFCYDLTSVSIGDNLSTIGALAFRHCYKLTTLFIGCGVETIRWDAFLECEKLADVYYNGSKEQWQEIFIDENNEALLNANVWFNHGAKHAFRSYTSDNNATCTKDGTETARCDYCNKIHTRTVKGSAKGHSYVAATCTKAKMCSRCKATSGKALGHSYTVATCTKPKTCSRCKATSGKALGHSYKNAITKKATTSENGEIVKKCTVCGSATSTTVRYIKTIKLYTTSYTYNGKTKAPTVIVKDSAGKTLKKDTDYTVTYGSGRKNVGTYKVTVKMKGNYTGTKVLTFKINPAKVTSKFSFKLSDTKLIYNGKAKTPTVTVKDASGKTLKKNTDYTVSYAKGRKNVGTYKVTIKMKGNYTGTKTLTFKIVPKAASINKLTAKSKAIIVKLNRSLQQSTGYEIQYSTKKNFSGAKTKVIKSYKTSSVTLTGLKAKTTYYIRIRTYKTVDGVKYYSNWCTYKNIRTK